MLKYYAVFCTALLTMSCSHSPKHSGGPGTIPLKDFFRNVQVNQYLISPDGTQLAFLKSVNGRMNVFLHPINEPHNERQLTNETERDIESFIWKGNEYIVYAKDFGGDENFHLFAVDLKTNDVRDLTPFHQTQNLFFNDLRYVSDHEILITSNRRNPEFFDVYRVDVRNGKMALVGSNPGKFTSWLADHRGRVRAAVSTDGVNSVVYYRDNEGQAFREIIKTDFKNKFEPQIFTFDNNRIVANSNLNRDKTAIVEFDPHSRREVRVLFEHPEVDADYITVSHKRKVYLGVRYTTWKRQRHSFDTEFKRIVDHLNEKLPNFEFNIVSNDDAETKHIVRTYSDRSMGAYYLFDVKTNELKLLNELSPWLNPGHLAEMKPVQFQSRDGLTIHGYLTLPPGRDPKNLPLVVNPHGGPWFRDTWGFNAEVQFLANRGYAVFQPNFRGSTGYGKKFWMASFKQWGGTMLNDVTDGVEWLKSQGIVHSNKICIYGQSYGGYKTLAALTFTPQLYRCGVDYVGVSNLFSFMESIPPYWEPYREMLYEMIGHPVKDRLLLTQVSPLFHVDKIKAPLLVAQGANDPRVKQQESDQIVNSLKRRGIDVPYLLKKNEGHGFYNEENRIEFYQAMERFLRRHL